MFTNPVLLSIILMLVLCFFRFNVFLAILVSGIFAGMFNIGLNTGFGDISAFFDALKTVTSSFISGMKGNLETSLSYILVGALAMAIGKSNLTIYLVNFVSKYLTNKKFILLITIALISCTSQNLIPIHIALIPILITPLISLFNKLKIDRRAVACAITFGITTPYMTLPLGFGLIFQNIIKDQLNNSGLNVTSSQVAGSVWLLVFIMLFGLITSLLYYLKPREYKAIEISYDKNVEAKFGKRELSLSLGLLITLILQITTGSLAISALIGFLFIVITGGVKYSELNSVFNSGFALMGYVAFIMLVAAGYGDVLRSTGGIQEIVDFSLTLTNSKILITFIMLCVGLLITLGIGSSFGTVPIIATLFTPICLGFGFSVESIIFIMACAGAVGDTGSPASESTLGVYAGLNSDEQCDHIKDVCIPTFIFYNIPLVVLGTVIANLI